MGKVSEHLIDMTNKTCNILGIGYAEDEWEQMQEFINNNCSLSDTTDDVIKKWNAAKKQSYNTLSALVEGEYEMLTDMDREEFFNYAIGVIPDLTQETSNKVWEETLA